MTVERIFSYAVPGMTKTAKPSASERDNTTLELRVRDKPFVKVYKMFEDNLCACAVLTYMEGVAKY